MVIPSNRAGAGEPTDACLGEQCLLLVQLSNVGMARAAAAATAAKRVGRRNDDVCHGNWAQRGDLIRWAVASNTVGIVLL